MLIAFNEKTTFCRRRAGPGNAVGPEPVRRDLEDDRGQSIEASYKRGGKLIAVAKRTIAPDGKRMTQVYENKLTGRASTYVAEKQ
jgi:hypothetical protein